MRALRTTRPDTRDRRGATLLLALIIVAATLAAGIGASIIVVNEFRTASSIDKGMAAYYAADAGMERALFTVYNNRIAGTAISSSGCDNVCSQVRNNNPPMSLQPAAVSGEQFNLFASRNDRKSVTVSIKQNQSAQLDLTYGYPSFSSSSAPPRTLFFSPVSSIVLNGNASNDEQPLLEVQWVYLMKSSQKNLQPENSTIRLISKKNVRYGFMIDLFTGTMISTDNAYTIVPNNPIGLTDIPADFSLSNVSGWIVSVKALASDVENLSIYACTGTDTCAEGSSSRYTMSTALSISSRGSAGGAQHTLYAKVPLMTPATGVFSYVLFSEETIEKPD
ncbi:MAG: hypothetical protein V1907_00020 [Candidatus Kerfeldbacteria bacterium]